MSGADVSMQMLLSFAQLARLYAANWIPQPTFWFPASRRISRQTWVVSLFYCQMGPSSNRQALVVSLFNFQMGPSSKGVRSRLSRSKSSSGSAPSDRDKKEGGIGRTLCERHGLSGVRSACRCSSALHSLLGFRSCGLPWSCGRTARSFSLL